MTNDPLPGSANQADQQQQLWYSSSNTETMTSTELCFSEYHTSSIDKFGSSENCAICQHKYGDIWPVLPCPEILTHGSDWTGQCVSGVDSDYMTFTKWVCFGKLKPNSHIIKAVHCG